MQMMMPRIRRKEESENFLWSGFHYGKTDEADADDADDDTEDEEEGSI